VKRPAPQGNALVVVMVAIAVLTILVVGAIRFTGTNHDAAVMKNRSDQMGSCADAARRYLIAQLPVNPLSPSATELNPADTTVQFERIVPRQATIVSIAPLAVGAARKQVRDIANSLGPGTLGGQYYRVVVRCIEPGSTRASELEFSFRYGI
jgi:hypothetical protein